MTQHTKEKRYQAALAGLLHDVGKISQRASDIPTKPPEGHDDTGQLVHAAFSQQYIQDTIPEAYRKYALHGVFHHQPEKSKAEDKSLSHIVALADKLSAGERHDQSEANNPMQLVSIFERVAIGRKRKASGFQYLPLEPLRLDESVIFPTQNMDLSSQKAAYSRLLEGLSNVFKNDPGTLETYLENALEGLRKFAWCVPSSYYYNLPDVSLYDHSRMTAALAACLADWDVDEITRLHDAVKHDFQKQSQPGDEEVLSKEVALLIGGDISGIQDFIYTVTSKNAARTLRGRSFYLQLLTEAILRFVLRELEIPYTNVIYSGGGHFFLLAPASAADKIDQVRRTVTKKLLQHHGTQLYLALAYVPVPASGFKVGNFPQYWSAMHKQLSIQKQHRYTELGDEIYPLVFEVPEAGGNPDATCSVCGDETRRVRKLNPEEEESGGNICTLCQSFYEDLGKSLPNARYIALGFGEPKDDKSGNVHDVLASFGMTYQWASKSTDEINLPDADYVVIWALDDPINNAFPTVNKLPYVQTLHYMVNLVPQDQHNRTLPFDALQEKVEGGFKRLGVLRMDVDDMGSVFNSGFAGEPNKDKNDKDKNDKDKNIASLARLSTLSFQLSLFFEGWLKVICQQNLFKGLVYAVYTGGDDLFLIGPWDIMPKLALEINRQFHKYTCNNQDLHISGGMAFIGGKYPVYQAAEDAGEAEDLAKSITGKDAFAFLGSAWKWEQFETICCNKKTIVDIVKELKGPKELIDKLRKLAADEQAKADKFGRPIWGPWMWRGAYYFTRMKEQYKDKEELTGKLEKIHDDLENNEYQNIALWGTAARWAQLETRKKS